MGRKILMVLLVMALIISLPIFSYAFTNEIPISTDANGNIYNGVGYKANTRLNSSGAEVTANGWYVSGFIPIVVSDVVRMQDLAFLDLDGSGGSYSLSHFTFYDSSFGYLVASPNYSVSSLPSSAWNPVYDDDGQLIQFTIPSSYSASIAYMRLTALNINSDSILTVNEEIPVFHSVSVSSSSGGSASADVTTSYEGQTVTLTATPNTDYYFSHWEVLSGGVTISNNKFTMPDADVSVRAVFAPIEYDISVSSSSGGTASANLSKATYGQTVTLTATPSDGYTFSEWEVTSGNASVINNQFIMPRGDVSVKAVFLPIPVYSVTVESDGNGVGSANPTSGYAGTAVTLSAVPALGYEFDRWEVTSGSVSIVNDEFTLPAADVVIKAHFKPIIYTITLRQGSNGSATVSKTTGIIGDVITLTATPDEYYNFSHWNVIEGGITVDGNSFSMPASNVVIQPVFVEQSAISSGFELHTGSIDSETAAAYELIDVDFGEQPAGDYLINIYHWGADYNPSFQIVVDGKYLGFANTGGVSTASISHEGGSLVLDGSVSLVRTSIGTADGTLYATNDIGTITWEKPTSWTFNIEDIVLIPVGISDVEDYGIYSSIVSFLKGQFRELISVFGSQEAEEDVNQASDELNQEVEELNNLSDSLTEHTSDIEEQMTTDFAISDDLTSQTGNFQSIYTGLFSSLGLFSIFIWLPVLLAVIKKLLRL